MKQYKVLNCPSDSALQTALSTYPAAGWEKDFLQWTGEGWSLVLSRETEWHQPFLNACKGQTQADLVNAIIGALEAAADPNISQYERKKRVRELLKPHVVEKSVKPSGSQP